MDTLKHDHKNYTNNEDVLTGTSGVLEDPLDENRVLGDPLGDQQNALRDAEPSHDAAAHDPLWTHTHARTGWNVTPTQTPTGGGR